MLLSLIKDIDVIAKRGLEGKDSLAYKIALDDILLKTAPIVEESQKGWDMPKD